MPPVTMRPVTMRNDVLWFVQESEINLYGIVICGLAWQANPKEAEMREEPTDKPVWCMADNGYLASDPTDILRKNMASWLSVWGCDLERDPALDKAFLPTNMFYINTHGFDKYTAAEQYWQKAVERLLAGVSERRASGLLFCGMTVFPYLEKYAPQVKWTSPQPEPSKLRLGSIGSMPVAVLPHYSYVKRCHFTPELVREYMTPWCQRVVTQYKQHHCAKGDASCS